MTDEDPTPHLERFATYEEARREFRWNIPERFNIARAICRRHGDAVTRVALVEVRPAATNTYTFGALDYFSDKFATVLVESGACPGDRVAVMLPQSAALCVAHFGVLKLGAVVVPLQTSASSAEIDFILKSSNARTLVVDGTVRDRIDGVVKTDSSLDAVFVVSDNIHSHVVKGEDRSFWREVYEASSDFRIANTSATSAAVILYATTREGAPRGLVHSHAALIGNLPAFEMSNNFDFSDDAVL